MLDLNGRGVLIAGAKRVGAVVANRIADEGANVAITYRSSLEEAETAPGRDRRSLVDRTALIQANLSDEAGRTACGGDRRKGTWKAFISP